MSKRIVYFVEGETEKKLIDAIKNKYVLTGTIYNKINLLQDKITNSRLIMLKPQTTVVIIYDTDVEEKSNLEKLISNINTLKASKSVKEIITIPQVKNFEDEIKYSTSIKKLSEIINKQIASENEFKKKFLAMSKENILSKLEKNNFEIKKLWSRTPKNLYREIPNLSERIKIEN